MSQTLAFLDSLTVNNGKPYPVALPNDDWFSVFEFACRIAEAMNPTPKAETFISMLQEKQTLIAPHRWRHEPLSNNDVTALNKIWKKAKLALPSWTGNVVYSDWGPIQWEPFKTAVEEANPELRLVVEINSNVANTRREHTKIVSSHDAAIRESVRKGEMKGIDGLMRTPATDGLHLYIHRDDATEYLKRCGFVVQQTEAKNEGDRIKDRQRHVQSVLDNHGGNKAAAARELGITRQRVSQILDKTPRNKAKKQASPWDALRR